MIKNTNPVFNEKSFKNFYGSGTRPLSQSMTLQGAVNKTFFLLILCSAAAFFSWNAWQTLAPFLSLISITAFILAVVQVFKPSLSPVLSPIYAIGQGLVLGVISNFFEATFAGIVLQAIGITLVTLLVMLSLYKARIITVTAKLRSMIISATMGIFIFYLLSFVLSIFGVKSFFYGSSMLSILVSVFVCIVAAFNFLLDFDFIERASQYPVTPKYMEWYGAFGVLVTVIWLYIELLSLLSKIKGRD